MEKPNGKRLTAGINRNLDKNYVWPENFASARTIMTDERNKRTETNEIDTHESVSHQSANKSNHTSRHSTHTKCSKSSIELLRKRVELEAEKAKQVLLDQALKEKLKIIEMERQLREAEILELEERHSQMSCRRSESLNLHEHDVDISPKSFLENDPVTEWVNQIPNGFDQLSIAEVADVPNMQMNSPQHENAMMHSYTGPNNPVIQMTSGHLDQICQIMRKNCQPGTSGLGSSNYSSLPKFDGNPEDWAIFLNQFKRTTEIYRISDEENIIRLQKCLTGRARESVLPLLISSSNISKIIQTLEITFGRPEFIISTLIEKVRKAPPPKEGRFETYLPFSNVVENLVTTMQVFNSTGHMNNPQLLSEVIVKLPPFLRLEWAKTTITRTDVTLKEFSDWLREIAIAASSCISAGIVDKKVFENDNFESRRKKENVFSTGKIETGKKSNCNVCKKSYHPVEECDAFKQMDVNEKWKYVTSKKLCFACLRPAHTVFKCRKRKKCSIEGCEKFHHSILHNPDMVKTFLSKDESSDYQSNHSERIHHSRDDQAEILLRIAPVKLKSHNKEIFTFALFDEAATTTLVDSRIAEEIGLDGPVEPLCYQWLNEVSRNEDDSKRVSLNISGVDETAKTYRISGARTVRDLSLPKQTIDVDEMAKMYPYIKQVPVVSFRDAQPMILIGQDQCALTIARKLYQGSSWNTPFVSKTLLGWVIHGRKPEFKQNLDRSLVFHLCCSQSQENDEYLHNLVKDSFKTENFGVKIIEGNGRSKEDERALEIMEKTLKMVEGRFELGLLWRNDADILPDSKTVAMNRLKCMERKMDKNVNFSERYCAKIEEYLKKGYIRKLEPDEAKKDGPRTWYLPHFGVINPNKPTKLRLVFDAAAKSNGISLNTQLLQGPDLLRSLTAILWKFRQRKIAFCGDIREMFHQILIRDEDCSAQRFYWRGNDRSRFPDVYEMKAMTFGATSSPCMAQFVKNRNAENHLNEFPEAAKAIIDKHYVDDYLDGTDSEVQAAQLISQVIEVHRRGGFEICNWICNSQEVLRTIPDELRSESQKKLNSFCQEPSERILGLWWRPETDDFTFSTHCHKVNPNVMNSSKFPTKREVLQLTMSVFDPLGFLSPLIIKFKIFMQDIWRLGIGWDDMITPEMESRWTHLMQEFRSIETIFIPRWYGPNLSQSTCIELHGFCDSSEKAFAAVVYLRFVVGNIIHVAFVSAKTRVAPLKQLSIPKLELQAAVMLSRLMNTIQSNLEIKISTSYLWTDSSTVLYWIRSESKRFKTFVSHRVGEILGLTDVSSWCWVPGEENVADESTRQIPNKNNNWLDGPEFLRSTSGSWPKEKREELNLDMLEIKKEKVLITRIIESYLPDVQRFSKYRRLVRTTAWMMRFIENCRTREKITGELKNDEIERAERILLKYIQSICFPEEISDLKKEKSVCNTSKLLSLSPFIDEEGILRIKGRLQNSEDLNFFQKFPIILDPKHRFTKLLIEDYHNKFQHQGQELLINEIRQKFWILKIRSAVRTCSNNCFYCKKSRAKPAVPQMGQLPECRLQSFVRPFTITGMDYFGPVTVTIGRRHEKRYIVLFTCMSVRAVHLEIASTLNTDSAIMAIRRFIGRRGYPREIHSDNGTNLHSANKELKNAVKNLKKEDISAYLTTKEINWKFIPAASPHMGGSWERLIKCVKSVLRVTLKERCPKEEVLYTLVVEAENMVNSRPLTYVSSDSNDPESITPNHFLLNSSSGASPVTGKFDSKEINLRKQWRVSQALSDMFWRRWVKEYLPTLNKKGKWHSDIKNVKVNDVVIVVDDTQARNSWPLGVIQRVYNGKDGKVRVVDVKMKNGTFRRPVAKICRLSHVTEE